MLKKDSQTYISFEQPGLSELKRILGLFSWQLDADTKLVFWGLLFNLLRILQSEVGIGNHYKVYRPLTDPEKSLVGKSSNYDNIFNILEYDGPDYIQVVGIEVFGINTYLRNLLDWSSLEIWFAIEINELKYQKIWFLDQVNRHGEAIVPGNTNNLVGYFVSHNNKSINNIIELKYLYNTFREREIRWDWYKRKNTSWEEVKNIIKNIHTGDFVDASKLGMCQEIGLLDEQLGITSLGRSLIH